MKKHLQFLLAGCILSISSCSGADTLQPTQTPSPSQTPIPTEIISPGPEWMLVWADEFDLPDGSQLNPENWNYSIGTGNDGWGNNEWQYYTDRIENAFIQDGKLVIQALEEHYMGADYTSARVNTQAKADFTYGRFEVRAKLPNTQGIWPAIWMMPTLSKYGDWPLSGEIDIMEMIGRDPALVYGTLHYGNPKGDQSDSYFLPTLETFDQDFHVFALEREPGEFRWYVDDEMYHKTSSWYTSDPDAPEGAPFDQSFYWILNVAVGGNWPGYPDDSSEFPQQMMVDYVRVYQKK